jgi:aerobic C4-dicarboxylate transport protein
LSCEARRFYADSTSAAARRLPLGPLWLQVLAGMTVGILAGIFVPHQAVSLRPLGDLFVHLIRMTLPPLMFLSIGIARLGNLKEVVNRTAWYQWWN